MQETTTTTVQPLLEYFDRLNSLNKEEKDLVRAKFHPHLFLKKQFALQHGDVCQYFDFVVRGCLRLYKVGDEVFGDLHEFGALGKTVTRAELKQAV